MFDCGGEWFVVLPDSDHSIAVAEQLQSNQTTTVHHASGRPWLIGEWHPRLATVIEVGSSRLAVLGSCPASREVLASGLDNHDTIKRLDELAAKLPGSFSLIASVAGVVRVQGSISGLRRIYHARHNGLAIVANRADVLAKLTSNTVDDQWLATRLLYPALPHPLGDRVPWSTVSVLSPDSYLRIESDGRAQSVSWWTPPDPVVPLSDAAPGFRKALSAAVRARTEAFHTVSCDLSGGLDSSPLFRLAARNSERLIGFTTGGSEVFDDEMRWARSAAEGIEHVERDVLPPRELPFPYSGVQCFSTRFDEPFTGVPNQIRLTTFARRLSEQGAQVHLAGHGGDELLVGSKVYLRSLARRQPHVALQHARGHAALRRWRMTQVLRALTDGRSYTAWLRGERAYLTTSPRMDAPRLGWSFTPFRLPPWATATAVEAVDDLVDQESAVSPLSPFPGQHEVLDRVRNGARMIRQDQQVMEHAGLPMAAPYLDDRVVEAALAARLDERSNPWSTKPILLEAMSDVLPAQLRYRTTKTDASDDHQAGLRHNRAQLTDLFDGSRLAAKGLIDVDAIRKVILGPYPPDLWPAALWQTLACETWLRTVG